MRSRFCWICNKNQVSDVSAHGPNPMLRLVNREVFSLAWAGPSMYATSTSGLCGPKQLTNSNWEILLDGVVCSDLPKLGTHGATTQYQID